MSDVGHWQGHSSVQGWLWILYFTVDAMLLISPKNQLDLLSDKFMTQQEKTAHSFDAALPLEKVLLKKPCSIHGALSNRTNNAVISYQSYSSLELTQRK